MFCRTRCNWPVWYHWDISDLSVRHTLTHARTHKSDVYFWESSVQGKRKNRLGGEGFALRLVCTVVTFRHIFRWVTKPHTNPRLHVPAITTIHAYFTDRGKGRREGDGKEGESAMTLPSAKRKKIIKRSRKLVHGRHGESDWTATPMDRYSTFFFFWFLTIDNA